MSETRKIAAILVADVVGYSRLAGADEDRTLSRLRGLRSDLIDPAIAAHHGRIVKRTGDTRQTWPRNNPLLRSPSQSPVLSVNRYRRLNSVFCNKHMDTALQKKADAHH